MQVVQVVCGQDDQDYRSFCPLKLPKQDDQDCTSILPALVVLVCRRTVAVAVAVVVVVLVVVVVVVVGGAGVGVGGV